MRGSLKFIILKHMSKQLITIGFELPYYSDLYKSYKSKQSLLDADIIIFEPTLWDYGDYDTSTYQGKTCYSENESFRLQEDTKHWRKELSTSLENGKTIFVFFGEYKECFIHTGQKHHSGTGRNTRTTNIVTGYHNYHFFPIELPPIIPTEGSSIKFENHPIFSSYWHEFKSYMKYESYIDCKIGTPIFLTKTGDKIIGSIMKIGKGHLVLLPPLRYEEKEFVKFNEKKNKQEWTEKAGKFGKRLFQLIIEIDRSLKSDLEKTPPPAWIDNIRYELPNEKKIRKKIEITTNKIDKLTLEKNKLNIELEKESSLKNLLYEKGKLLENSIIEALQILKFKAVNYNEGELEIDQVIVSPENDRFIGEAEGKDTSAVNIDKIRQLMSNIHEDLQKEDIEKPAIGILFGNGFRLTEPSKREEQFTTKCLNTAKAQNYILIRTSDLFLSAKYIRESGDQAYAKKCRKAIKKGKGSIVVFPKINKNK